MSQFMEYQKEMRKRLNIEKYEPARITELQLSDVSPVGDYLESESPSYVHNATKIDALAEPELEIEVS